MNTRTTTGVAKGIGTGWPSDWLSGFESGTLIKLLQSASYGQDDELTDPFTQHVWVYACVKARARAISSTPVQFFRGDDPSDKKAAELTSGPLVDVFKRPHPLIGAAKLWALTSIYWDLYGECYWLLHEKSGQTVKPVEAPLGGSIRTPFEICPVPGSAVTINWDRERGVPKSYRYSSGNAHQEYSPGAVLPFVDVGHSNPLRGVGGAEALRRRLETDFHAENLDMRAARNGGMPSVWISSDQTMSDPALDQLRTSLDTWISAPSRHQKPAVLHGGLKPHNPGFSPKDMENTEMRKWSRESILAVFGMTLPVLGLTEGLNYASARVAKRVHWEDHIVPQQQIFATVVRDGLLSRLTDSGGPVVMGWDRSGVEALGDSMDEKLDRVERMVGLGIDFNKAAELAGWEIDPLTDEERGVAQVEGQAAGVNAGQGDETARPDLTLNGAQIASLLSIIEQVAAGTLPKETAAKVIVASFPFDEARARDLLADIEEGSQEPEPTPPALAPPVPPGEEPEAVDAPDVEDRAIRAPRTAQARETYARAFEDFLAPHESRIQAAVEPVQRGFMDAVRTKLRQATERSWRPKNPTVRALEDDVPPEVLRELERIAIPGLAAWAERMAEAVEPEFVRTYFEAVAAMAAELGVDTLLPDTDATSLAFLSNKAIQLAEGATSTLAEETRNAIARTMFANGGEFTIADIQERIAEALEPLESMMDERVGNLSVRAQRIARTEAAAVTNRARVAEMTHAGVGRHVWVSSRDSHVRDSHASLDGREVAVGESFQQGLRWPLDEGAPASEVVNCRCTTAPVNDLTEDLIDQDPEL